MVASSVGCLATLAGYIHSKKPFQEGSAHRMLVGAGTSTLRSPTNKECIVVGAGLEGMSTAYCLMKQGWKVTVIDSADAPAARTSFANAVLVIMNAR